MLALGRSLPHDSLAEAVDADPSDAARGAARGRRGAHHRRRRARRLPLPPRAAAARSSTTTCCPASAPTSTCGSPRRSSARLALHDGDAILAAGVAHHYLASGDQPAAFAASLRAADAAERVHAYGEAAAQLERALDLWPRVPDAEEIAGCDRAGLLGRAGKARVNDSDYARAETLPRARRRGDRREARAPPRRRPAARRSRGRAGRSGGRRTPRATIDQAAALLPDGDESVERARILAWNAKALMLQSRYGESQPGRRARRSTVARQAGDSKSLGDALNAIGTSLISTGSDRRGRRRAARGDRHGAAETGATSSGHVNLADALHLVGRSEEALAVALEACELGERREREPRVRMARAAGRRHRMGPRALGGGARAHAAGPHAGRHAARLRGAAPRRDRARRRPPRRRRAVARPRAAGRQRLARAAVDRLGGLAARRARAPPRRHRRRADASSTTRSTRSSSAPRTCARIARLAQVGAQIEADAAERARDLGDPDAERLAICARRGLRRPARGLRGRLASRRAGAARERAGGAAARARRGRRRGRTSPRPRPGSSIGWPYPRAIERLLEAQVADRARRPRGGVGRDLGAAREQALAIGAAWLLSELDGLAERARLAARRGSDRRLRPAAPAEIDDPFGLTPREQQVLALVAERLHQPRDRPAALHGREDRERARLADPRQARRAQPHGGRRGRPPARPDGRASRRPTQRPAAASRGQSDRPAHTIAR